MDKTYYNEKLKTLPSNIRYAVIMSGWEKSLREIQNRFKLHVDQTQVLEDSVIQLMFGDIDAPDFINNMFNNGHINSETAADILLEVDLKILKNIRERLEKIDKDQKEAEEIENILLDEEEKDARYEADIYADYYEELEKAKKEAEEELLSQGILPDGSNITDEMLGITPEIPTDIVREKDDLLNEINNPTKSFKTEILSKPKTIPTDHQIENIQLEKPFHPEELLTDLSEKEKTNNINTVVNPVKITTNLDPKIEIKKPITVNLDDVYREPIE